MIVYKITNQDMTTHNNFEWEIGKLYKTSGKNSLCSDGWLHAYEHPLLAVLHNPIHGNFANFRMFKATTLNGVVKKDKQLKLGSNKMKLLEEIEIPQITLNQKIAYGILCALEVYKEKSFVNWAKNWLSGKDRSVDAAADAAAYAATAYAAAAAAGAADAAAAYVANADAAAAAAYAAYVANAAAYIANAADYAAYAAALNLTEIAKKCLKYK